MTPDLFFAPARLQMVFLRGDLTSYVEDVDTITRELVQNGLDAALLLAGRDTASFGLFDSNLRLGITARIGCLQ